MTFINSAEVKQVCQIQTKLGKFYTLDIRNEKCISADQQIEIFDVEIQISR